MFSKIILNHFTTWKFYKKKSLSTFKLSHTQSANTNFPSWCFFIPLVNVAEKSYCREFHSQEKEDFLYPMNSIVFPPRMSENSIVNKNVRERKWKLLFIQLKMCILQYTVKILNSMRSIYLMCRVQKRMRKIWKPAKYDGGGGWCRRG